MIRALSITFCIALLTGCTSTQMELKSLTRDMPKAIVDKYEKTDKAYVDQGNTFFLPLLLTGDEYVSKTNSGYQGYQSSNLAIVLADRTRYSEFNSKGKLLKTRSHRTFLAGLISDIDHYTSYKNGTKLAYSKKYLLRAFGSDKEYSGEESLTFFWIPFITKESQK